MSGSIGEALPAQAGDVRRCEDKLVGITRDLSHLYDEFTDGGKLPENVDERVMIQTIMSISTCYKGVSLDELATTGVVPWTNSGGAGSRVLGKTGDYELGKPWTSATDFTVKKQPWKTLTGRQQFYIDHDWFLKCDEALPGHKAPLTVDGYPLQMMMGHARHGIHTMWSDDPVLLRLQRGEPDIYINPADASARGVVDGDLVRVHNPAGQVIAQAHLSNGMPPGTLLPG